jgi:hypothetical protein
MRLISGCLVIGAAASISAVGGLHAQAVAQAGDSSGAVVGGLVGLGDAEAIPYGTVVLLQTNEARFTDGDGHFRMTRLAPGTYVIRARQIGYAPKDTTIRVDPGPAVTSVTISMRRLPPLLGLVKVEGHRPKDCVSPGVPDSATNATLAAIFAQVRENVDRYRVLWDEYPFRYTRDETVVLQQQVGRDSTVRAASSIHESRGQRRYQVGVVVANEVDSAGRVIPMMYLPTFRDLADSSFLELHCFTYGGSERLDPKSPDIVLRVDFQPAREIQTPDVEGSIYLDAQRLVVRRSVFRLTKPQAMNLASFTATTTYRELMQNVPVPDVTRTVLPVPLAAGRENTAAGARTIAREYRFTDYTFENFTPGEQPALTAQAPTQAVVAGKAAGHGVGVVEGRVVRADGTLIQGAAVGLLASHDSTATSDSGRFVIRNVSQGAHMLWVHGVGIKPTRIAVTVSADPRPVTITVARAVPVLPKVVTKASYPAGYVAVGLDKRIESGVGTIITFDQIKNMHVEKVSEMLHGVRGIHLRVYFDPDARVMSSQGGCVAYMLDGVPQKAFTSHDLDNLVSPAQIAAIEIYSPAEAPVGWGGATPGPSEETIKGASTPAGVQLDVTAGAGGATPVGGTAATASPVSPSLPEPCAVMAIWTIGHLNLMRGDTAVSADSGFRATASRATETSGTAVFPRGSVVACEPPAPSDAATLDVYAELRDTLPESVHDSAWRSYSASVLAAIRDAFAFPSEVELPVFGYASAARPTARNLHPLGRVVSPSLSNVVSFRLSPTGELLESHVAASSLSGEADTSVLAAIQGAATGNLFPSMPATGMALHLQSVRFDLMVTTTTPDAADLAMVLDQIDVPVWPLARPAALAPDKSPDLQALRASPGARSESATFELVVDENGKAIIPTARAISQTAAGAADTDYRGFVTQVAAELPKFQFEPALVGACAVRQIMLLPLTD